MKSIPVPRQAPGPGPSAHEPAPPKRAPGAPDQPDGLEAPPSPDPSTPSESDDTNGAVGVDPVEAHVGATEEQVGDRTGPGAGYDQARQKETGTKPR
jgi:hypothetical protein